MEERKTFMGGVDEARRGVKRGVEGGEGGMAWRDSCCQKNNPRSNHRYWTLQTDWVCGKRFASSLLKALPLNASTEKGSCEGLIAASLLMAQRDQPLLDD
jgi:hypothetical protein